MPDGVTPGRPRPWIGDFTAPDGLRAEEDLFDRFCRYPTDVERLSLWTQTACLVTTPMASRIQGFDSAAGWSALQGWPVHLRKSGGTTVFHSPEVLCVTFLFEGRGDGFGIDRAYRHFTTHIINALKRLGVVASTGEAPGAPCDGRFNILVEGRKLAGTAMRTRNVADRICVLGHAAILVGPWFAEGLVAVEAFEREMGLQVSYPATSSVCLEELIGPSASARLASALNSCLSQSPVVA